MKSELRQVLKGFFKKIQEITRPEKIYPFIQQYFFYLVWILFVPVLLYSMAQGRELFIGMFDDTNTVTGIRAGALVAIYFFQAMAIFLVPRPLFRNNTFDDWKKVRPTTLRNPGLVYFLALLPMVLYGLVMIVVQWSRIPGWGFPLIALALGGGLFLAYWFEDRWKYQTGPTLWMLLGNVVLCMAWWLTGLSRHFDPFWNYFVVGSCLMLQLALLGGLTKRLHEQLESGRTRTYDRLYLASALTILGGVLFLAFSRCLDTLSPTFLLLTITTFYLFLSSLGVAFYRYNVEKKRWKLWVFWPAAIGVLLVIFVFKSPIHRVSTVPGHFAPDRRLSFDEWFARWYETNLLPDSAAAEIPIYLVAAQGGGSRAGLWTSELLNRLEVHSGYRFHRHCLAITAASGGSAGTGATLALWRFAGEQGESLPVPKDSLHLNFAQGMFHRNYLSGSFFDVFLGEVANRFMFFRKDRRNRNYRHQKDEALAYANGLRRTYAPPGSAVGVIGQRFRSLWAAGSRERLDIGAGHDTPNYPFQPYLSFWYGPDGRPRTDLPLYLPITSNIHSGQSGYCSPVQQDPHLFIDAIDVLRAVDTNDTTRTLSMAGATNLSELFPLVNAFTFIPGSGNYLDGGTFENMGLTALLEIYRRTDSLARTAPYIPPALRQKIRIHVIYIINNALESQALMAKVAEVKPKSQVFSLFSYAGNSSIAGHSTFYMTKLEQSLQPRDQLHQLWMQDADSISLNVPLGRWLSMASVKAIKRRADLWDPAIRTIVAPLRDQDGLPTEPPSHPLSVSPPSPVRKSRPGQ